MSTTETDHPGVILFPPLILAIALVPIQLLAPVPARIAGSLIAIAAATIAISARHAMVRVGTNIRPDKPALALAATGPYVYTRNPMYLALCLLQLGIGLFVDGALPVLFVLPLALVLHFGVVKREERYLAGKFGESYLAYTRRVRRWI